MSITVTRQELAQIVDLATKATVPVAQALNMYPLFTKLVKIVNGTQDLHTPGNDAAESMPRLIDG